MRVHLEDTAEDSNSTETPMVLQGLREASQQRNSPILRLLVLSRMDGTVLWGGDVKGTTSARIDYLPHVLWLVLLLMYLWHLCLCSVHSMSLSVAACITAVISVLLIFA